jgi:multidrug resistance efflux pump
MSETEYNQARYAVDVARAELRGDEVEAGQIKLRQAEEELTRAAELRSQSRISEEEYNEAVLRVELLRVGTKP